MVIGNGLLGSIFKSKYIDDNNIIFICSGVSNSNEINEIEFSREKDLVLYNDFDDLYEKIEYYLNNETERKIIETNGYNKALSLHTYDNRAKQLIEIINSKL
jgi:spore maturation protein CgeB